MAHTRALQSTAIGTPHWMAPEVIREDGHGSAADVWSLGITALELAETRPPHWGTRSALRVLFAIAGSPPPRLANPDDWPAGLSSFLDGTLRVAPAERLSAAELLDHPYVKGAGGAAQQRFALVPLAQRAIAAADSSDDAAAETDTESTDAELSDAELILDDEPDADTRPATPTRASQPGGARRSRLPSVAPTLLIPAELRASFLAGQLPPAAVDEAAGARHADHAAICSDATDDAASSAPGATFLLPGTTSWGPRRAVADDAPPGVSVWGPRRRRASAPAWARLLLSVVTCGGADV